MSEKPLPFAFNSLLVTGEPCRFIAFNCFYLIARYFLRLRSIQTDTIHYLPNNLRNCRG